MKISRITIGRLFNLGSYEHIRYELTIDVADGESAAQAVLGAERILSAMKPKGYLYTDADILREEARAKKMAADVIIMSDDQFRREYGHFVGSAREYAERCCKQWQEHRQEREAYKARCEKARAMFDDLGGASQWTDAKLEWDEP